MKKKLYRSLEDYLLFLPSYLKSTILASIVDIFVYTISKPKLGTNLSIILAFSLAQLTLFFILSSLQVRKIKKKRDGISLQLLIGTGTLFIQLIVINTFEKILEYSFSELYVLTLQESSLFLALSRVLSIFFGFLWTSIMTKKLIFSSKRKKGQ